MTKRRSRISAGHIGCPTCGHNRWGIPVRKGNRAYLKGLRIYWPLYGRRGSYGGYVRRCDDEWHNRWRPAPYTAIKRQDEAEHVANLPVVGRVKLPDEARERAKDKQRLNRQRQGKDSR